MVDVNLLLIFSNTIFSHSYKINLLVSNRALIIKEKIKITNAVIKQKETHYCFEFKNDNIIYFV